MKPERQRDLGTRIIGLRDAGGRHRQGEPYRHAMAHYTDDDRLAAEREVLFRRRPTLVALSADIPQGHYMTASIDRIPLLLTRDDGGNLRAFLNVCRHRGAPVADGSGPACRLTCPYHGWTYGLDGRLRSRPRPEAFEPNGQPSLIPVAVGEACGLIYVRPDGRSEIDMSALLDDADEEIRDFELASYSFFDEHTQTRRMNWKFAVDTFLESYHVPHLHRRSLASRFDRDLAVFDRFGPNGRLAVARESFAGAIRDGTIERILAHTTLLYLLFPNSVLIYQQDHVQLVRVMPGTTPDECTVMMRIYTPAAVEPSDLPHWQRNRQILIEVTDEDFALGERLQLGLAAAGDRVVYGRNEAGLAHFHEQIAMALDATPIS